IGSSTMIWPAYQFHARCHTPVGEVNILACLEKMKTHRKHGSTSIDQVGHARIGMYRCIACSPPAGHRSFINSRHMLFLPPAIVTFFSRWSIAGGFAVTGDSGAVALAERVVGVGGGTHGSRKEHGTRKGCHYHDTR